MPCTLCGELSPNQIEIMYEYEICKCCKSKLRLHRDKTLKKYILDLDEQKRLDSKKLDLREEMEQRLDFIEKDYIKKKIKLQYIIDRIDDFAI